MKINGETHYLRSAVDHEGEVLEAYVPKRRNTQAALKAMKRYGSPEFIVTDLLRSYKAAMKEIGNVRRQVTKRSANNRAENSHLPLLRRQQAMLKFRLRQSLQVFAAVHSSVYSLFNLERHFYSIENIKRNRAAALLLWRQLGGGWGTVPPVVCIGLTSPKEGNGTASSILGFTLG